MPDTYPWALVKRLLEHWPELAEGRWPAEGGMPEGYRGKRTRWGASFEPAIDAHVDLGQAVGQLPPYLRRAIHRRYWQQRRPGPYDPAWNVLVDAVWQEIN